MALGEAHQLLPLDRKLQKQLRLSFCLDYLGALEKKKEYEVLPGSKHCPSTDGGHQASSVIKKIVFRNGGFLYKIKGQLAAAAGAAPSTS
jgi:hypothetical protein